MPALLGSQPRTHAHNAGSTSSSILLNAFFASSSCERMYADLSESSWAIICIAVTAARHASSPHFFVSFPRRTKISRTKLRHELFLKFLKQFQISAGYYSFHFKLHITWTQRVGRWGQGRQGAPKLTCAHARTLINLHAGAGAPIMRAHFAHFSCCPQD